MSLAAGPGAAPVPENPLSTWPSKPGDAPPFVTAAVDDDAALVAQVRAGHGAAFDMLVARHGHRLHGMLLHLAGGDRDLAAEFTQEAFVRAYTRLDQFAGESGFYTWLYRLARNRALDLLARKRPTATAPEQFSRRAAAGDGPGERLAVAEVRDAVQRALARLPAELRELLLLREFDNLDYSAIAAVLDIPEGTVKSRLNRARAALRGALAGRLGPEDLA